MSKRGDYGVPRWSGINRWWTNGSLRKRVRHPNTIWEDKKSSFTYITYMIFDVSIIIMKTCRNRVKKKIVINSHLLLEEQPFYIEFLTFLKPELFTKNEFSLFDFKPIFSRFQ